MYELFNNYGECEVRLIMCKERGTPKGIAFVEYGTVAEMKAAIGNNTQYVIIFNPGFFFVFYHEYIPFESKSLTLR